MDVSSHRICAKEAEGGGILNEFFGSFLGCHGDSMSSRERSLKLYRLERERRDGCGRLKAVKRKTCQIRRGWLTGENFCLGDRLL
jgi:hypothetical protein